MPKSSDLLIKTRVSLPAIFLFVALNLLPMAAHAQTDARASDSVDAFSQLCVSMFVGREPYADPQRFVVTELDDETRQMVKPDIQAAQLWDVYAKASDASMLMHYEPQGLCMVEIAEADESSVQTEVARSASNAAATLGATAVQQESVTKIIDGLTATTSSWRFPSEDGDILIMVTTVPEPRFMIQHVLSVSYVR